MIIKKSNEENTKWQKISKKPTLDIKDGKPGAASYKVKDKRNYNFLGKVKNNFTAIFFFC